MHPNVLPVVEGVLDTGCLISSLSSIAICAGETPQPIHADDQLIPIPKPHPPTVCNTMWALTDFTEANGATRIIPGTHLSDRLARLRRSTTTRSPRRCRAGRVLVWHGSLWHGGGANTTDERRIGIAMNYCAGYIRQQENQQLGIPRDIAAGFEPAAPAALRLQRVLRAHRPHRQARPHRAAPRRRAPTAWCGTDEPRAASPTSTSDSTRSRTRHRTGATRSTSTPGTRRPTRS